MFTILVTFLISDVSDFFPTLWYYFLCILDFSLIMLYSSFIHKLSVFFHPRCLVLPSFFWRYFYWLENSGLIFSVSRLKVLGHFLLTFVIANEKSIVKFAVSLYITCPFSGYLQQLFFIVGYMQFDYEVIGMSFFGFILFWISACLRICRFTYFITGGKFSATIFLKHYFQYHTLSPVFPKLW